MKARMLEAAQAMHRHLRRTPEGGGIRRAIYKRRAKADLTQPGIPPEVRAASLQLLVFPARIKEFK